MPELLRMPMPLMVKALAGTAVMVKALAPALKTMLFTSTEDEREGFVLLELPKLAISEALFGTVAGVQLLAVFQSALAGCALQVALPAWASRIKEEARV